MTDKHKKKGGSSFDGAGYTDRDLRKFVRVYESCNRSKSAAAKKLGVSRQTLQKALRKAVTQIGFVDGPPAPVVEGRVAAAEAEVRPLPTGAGVARYILTSLQNNTYLHPAWTNLATYADWLNAIPGSSCELLVGTFSYDYASYGKMATKRGKAPTAEDTGLWYAPEVEPFFKDEAIELAPGLVWCGHMNIMPTTKHPLTGLETYNGRKSNIVPHVKQTMESVPSMPDEGTKFNFSTGTIGQRHYIQKSAGIIAEQAHAYGGLLVEVDSEGSWWVRVLRIDEKGRIYDIGPRERHHEDGAPAVRVVDGVVHEDAWVRAIVWGDVHTAEMEPWVRECGWAPGGMLDTLRPREQIMHDIFSMRSRGHHEMKDFHALYKKRAEGADNVKTEVEDCASFLRYAARPDVEIVVVPSNHDRHLTRWLNEEDPRKDLVNARYHVELQSALLGHIDAGDAAFNVLAYALGREGLPEGIRFLEEDESHVICKGSEVEPGGIECGLHGDLGPAGARGSTRNLAKLGRPVIKGHDHTATIRDNVYSVGACSLEFPYMKGPSAHSVTHCVVFENGARQLVTMWEGKWRA
jgi:hypothetical protein